MFPCQNGARWLDGLFGKKILKLPHMSIKFRCVIGFALYMYKYVAGLFCDVLKYIIRGVVVWIVFLCVIGIVVLV